MSSRANVRDRLAAAMDHQGHAYGELVRALRLPRDPSRVPLVPIIFNIDNLTGIDELRFPGLDARFVMNPRAHEHFEWFVNLADAPSALVLSWHHNSELFRAATMHRHVERFRALLSGLAKRPDLRIGDAGTLLGGTLAPASGRMEDPGAAGVQQIPVVFDRVAERFGDRVALRFGGATLSYAELKAQADALAAALAALGVGAGDLVGITSTRSLQLVVAVLGALKAGAGYVPFDLTLPADRLRFMATDTQVKVLLGQSEAVAAAGVPELPFSRFPAAGAAAPAVTITGESIAYVMYTSGTTGKPKGVVLPHRSVIRMLVDTDWLSLSEYTVTLHSSAFAFDTSIIDLFAALLHGGTVVIPPDGALSIDQLAAAVGSHGVNTLWLTSGLFHAIADLRPQVFAQVRQVIVGGDVVSPVQVKKVMDSCPGCQVINGYGPTESNVTNAYAIQRADVENGQALPIGRAIAGTQVWIVDEQLRPVEASMQGELCISGRGLALGYHNRPELTAAKFVTAPWDPTLRLYRSGDLAMDPGDGVIRFFGRMDGQVKIRGFRVETVEVETVLAAHGCVAQAVVSALVPPGQLDKVLVAWVVAKGAGVSRAELQAWCRERLPDFAQPLHWQFVATIPLNHNGKVDRGRLPPPDWHAAAAVDSALHGPHETRIAAIWRSCSACPESVPRRTSSNSGVTRCWPCACSTRSRRSSGWCCRSRRCSSIRRCAPWPSKSPPRRSRRAPWPRMTIGIPRSSFTQVPPDGPAPLFIVGGVGGNVNNLYELGRALGTHRSLVGFQTRGILGHSVRTSIEAMAEEHIRYLRARQPVGPYLLAGYSGGALTAFEMARQLTAAGETVTELFILDTFAPGFAVDFRPRVRLTVAQRLRAELELLRADGIGFFWERASNRLKTGLLRRPLGWLRRWRSPELGRLDEVEDAWRLAAAAYRGGTYGRSVTLLLTAPRGLNVRLAHQQDPTLGWARVVAPGALRIASVPGSHLDMVRPPHVQVLAATIERFAAEPQVGVPVATRAASA